MLLNAAKHQGYSFYRFLVAKGKPIRGGSKITPPPPIPTQVRLNVNTDALDELS